MNQHVSILTGFISPEKLTKHLSNASINIAMTPGAMLAFDTLGEKYMTLDDLYDPNIFRNDMRVLTNELEELFEKLDRICEQSTGFPRAYTGNIYWFIVFFANILYLTRIADKIKNISASQSIFIGHTHHKGKFEIDPLHTNFSNLSLNFGKFCRGGQNKIDILSSALEPEVTQIKLPSSITDMKDSFEYKVRSYINRLTYLSGDIGRQKAIAHLYQWLSFAHKKKRLHNNIFIIQDAYEVRFLKPHLPDYYFVNPCHLFEKHIKGNNIDHGLDFNPVSKLIEQFVQAKFISLKRQIIGLFSAYHNNVVTKLGPWQKEFRDMLKRERPKALFYSIASVRVYEDVCAFVANEEKVPVFYFQHGGTSAFNVHPNQKYNEKNENINKIKLLRSGAEAEESKEKASEIKALGSIVMYNISRLKAPKKNRILYLCGPPVSHVYNDMRITDSDHEQYKLHLNVIHAIMKNNLSMDIKTHPASEINSYYYFKNLLRAHKATSVRLLHAMPAESIIKTYALIILEYLNSAIVPAVLMMNIPVICYLKDLWTIKPDALSDLEKRTYLVRDAQSFEKAISDYAQVGLKSKWTSDFVDKYIFSVNKGDPAPRIASYVKNRIMDSQ